MIGRQCSSGHDHRIQIVEFATCTYRTDIGVGTERGQCIPVFGKGSSQRAVARKEQSVGRQRAAIAPLHKMIAIVWQGLNHRTRIATDILGIRIHNNRRRSPVGHAGSDRHRQSDSGI